MSLSEDQNAAFEAIKKFLDDDDEIFLLKGYAGTGKTFLVKHLVEFLNSKGFVSILMAPTGRAAKTLNEKTGYEVKTIHSMIYNYSNKEVNENDELPKIIFKINDNSPKKNCVYIIDESSMISNEYSENDEFIFGSGYLLKDLIEFSRVREGNNKIIFVGDSAQLAPANSFHSPALDSECLRQEFDISTQQFTLKQILRQERKNQILANAEKIRESIENENFNKFKILTGETVFPCSDLVDKATNLMRKEKEDTILIAYTNRSVLGYNLAIREKLFPGEESLVAGDILVVARNNYSGDFPVMNGDFCAVSVVENEPETRELRLKVKVIENEEEVTKEETVPLSFRKVQLSFVREGKEITEEKYILENSLFSPERDISKIEKRALLVDFRMRHDELEPGSAEYREKIREDPYFNALLAKFGYAITGHKAQGGEWTNVLIDFKRTDNPQSENFFRWAYTTITRASEQLYVKNEPHFELNSNLRISDKELLKDHLAATYECQEDESEGEEFHFAAPPSSGDFYEYITTRLRPFGINYEKMKQEDHFERVQFINKIGDKASFDFFFNKKGTYTSLKSTSDPYASRELRTQIINAIIPEKTYIQQLIEEVESPYLEFKKSILWSQDFTQEDIERNLSGKLREFGKKASKFIIAKTIAGFMNVKGGKLIIGVEDDHTIFGIEDDIARLKGSMYKGKGFDGYKRMIQDQIIKFYFPREIIESFTDYITLERHEIKGKTILVIDVKKYFEEVPLIINKKKMVFIRIDGETIEKKGDDGGF